MGGLIPQPILYPFRDVARFARGLALQPAGDFPTVETEHYGPQPCIRTACAYDEEAGEVNVFVANCALEGDVALSLSLRAFGPLEPVEHIELYGADPDAHNTEELPDAVRPQPLPLDRPENGEIALTVRRHSWNVYRFRLPDKSIA
jgi:alpha-N-arabinofuranosidase